MTEVEKRRQRVAVEEVEKARAVLAEARVPSPRNPRPGDIGQPAGFVCLRCGNQWPDVFQIEERTCPQCRSNSVRWLRTAS